MSTEVELKARTADYEGCRRRMTEFAGQEGAFFLKNDSYWSIERGRPLTVRVRRWKQGEKAAEETLVTWKRKEIRGRIEINDEREWGLAGNSGASFEELLAALGLERTTVKQKQGWSWTVPGPPGEPPMTVELAEISGRSRPGAAEKNLGWFLELELFLEGEAGEAETAASERRFLAMLEQAGLGEENIERSYYSELLDS